MTTVISFVPNMDTTDRFVFDAVAPPSQPPLFGTTVCVHIARNADGYCWRCGKTRPEYGDADHHLCPSTCQCDVLVMTLPDMRHAKETGS